ncbi:MAG: hypothetical protein O2856_13155 [Planctomycetota bacterium]|nr:hypothetical protein [Planctomycetota bacterium]
MNRTTIKKTLSVAIVAMAVAMLVFWGRISEVFGPMKQHELQCLICHRNRVEKWVCGSKVKDEITDNIYSDWIDTFTPLDHQHVWMGHTNYNRHHWFGSTSIGCGGMPTIPRIFEQRASLGEQKAQKLAARFHELIESQSSTMDLGELFSELDSFTTAVVDDPESLLAEH